MKRLLLVLAIISTPVAAHDFYSGLRNAMGQGCCGGSDCAPREPCTAPGIPDGLIVEGVCYPIDPAKVLPMPSPDGFDHACMMPHDTAPRCFILTFRV